MSLILHFDISSIFVGGFKEQSWNIVYTMAFKHKNIESQFFLFFLSLFEPP